jgi:hypothetical protein
MTSEEEYEVERILNSRGGPGGTEFKVKWIGYEDPTWEPIGNLEHCSDKLNDFFNREQKRKVARGAPLTLDEAFLRLLHSNRVFMRKNGFLKNAPVDTSNCDDKWDDIPPMIKCPPEEDYHIQELIRKENRVWVRIRTPKGEIVDWEDWIVAEYFLIALQKFLETRAATLMELCQLTTSFDALDHLTHP